MQYSYWLSFQKPPLVWVSEPQTLLYKNQGSRRQSTLKIASIHYRSSELIMTEGAPYFLGSPMSGACGRGTASLITREETSKAAGPMVFLSRVTVSPRVSRAGELKVTSSKCKWENNSKFKPPPPRIYCHASLQRHFSHGNDVRKLPEELSGHSFSTHGTHVVFTLNFFSNSAQCKSSDQRNRLVSISLQKVPVYIQLFLSFDSESFDINLKVPSKIPKVSNHGKFKRAHFFREESKIQTHYFMSRSLPESHRKLLCAHIKKGTKPHSPITK